MIIKSHWLNLEYLKTGNRIQAEVYQLFNKYRLFEILRDYDPILVGTVPIGVNIMGSDLDIICEVKGFNDFERQMEEQFKDYFDFSITRRVVNDMERIKVNFVIEGWPIEIFGQEQPTRQQNGFRHMVIEDRMLRIYGKHFNDQIIQLKIEGLKTEPAFAKVLKLEGDPYLRLLEIYNWTDEEIRDLWEESNTSD
ncbi:DUF4269 domain-containing protein [Paenibacillus macquariensis]|nr:DUF4269 domain-containing protein [Paenibacillus macquariensis]MEC0091962.1 DUF4269 domain-containing protein [Paenibacillus macquariensis]OAB37463.1 hypothetical protein PMSM_05220 [Paenibacillus macquariensis subsp. macquariensis]